MYAKKLANILNQAAQFSLKRTSQPKDKKNQRKEGFTPELRRNKLNSLCRQVQKYPQCSRLYELYNCSKQCYTKLCKYQKYIHGRSHMQMLNDYTEENNNQFWQHIKSYNNKQSQQQQPPLDKMYEHFKNINQCTNNKVTNFDRYVIKYINQMNSNSLIIPELDKKITKEIIETNNKLKNNKAHGDDLIINEMLKAGNQILKILSSGTYPDTWCTGTIIPIYKSGDKENPSNYRGITVSNCLGKLFNTIINKRITTYLETNELLSDTQIGFRPGRHTTDHYFPTEDNY